MIAATAAYGAGKVGCDKKGDRDFGVGEKVSEKTAESDYPHRAICWCNFIGDHGFFRFSEIRPSNFRKNVETNDKKCMVGLSLKV